MVKDTNNKHHSKHIEQENGRHKSPHKDASEFSEDSLMDFQCGQTTTRPSNEEQPSFSDQEYIDSQGFLKVEDDAPKENKKHKKSKKTKHHNADDDQNNSTFNNHNIVNEDGDFSPEKKKLHKKHRKKSTDELSESGHIQSTCHSINDTVVDYNREENSEKSHKKKRKKKHKHEISDSPNSGVDNSAVDSDRDNYSDREKSETKKEHVEGTSDDQSDDIVNNTIVHEDTEDNSDQATSEKKKHPQSGDEHSAEMEPSHPQVHKIRYQCPENFEEYNVSAAEFITEDEFDPKRSKLYIIKTPLNFDLHALPKKIAKNGVTNFMASAMLKDKHKAGDAAQKKWEIHSFDNADSKKFTCLIHDGYSQLIQGPQFSGHIDIIHSLDPTSAARVISPKVQKHVPFPANLKIRYKPFGSVETSVLSSGSNMKSPKSKHKKSKKHKETDGSTAEMEGIKETSVLSSGSDMKSPKSKHKKSKKHKETDGSIGETEGITDNVDSTESSGSSKKKHKKRRHHKDMNEQGTVNETTALINSPDPICTPKKKHKKKHRHDIE